MLQETNAAARELANARQTGVERRSTPVESFPGRLKTGRTLADLAGHRPRDSSLYITNAVTGIATTEAPPPRRQAAAKWL